MVLRQNIIGKHLRRICNHSNKIYTKLCCTKLWPIEIYLWFNLTRVISTQPRTKLIWRHQLFQPFRLDEWNIYSLISQSPTNWKVNNHTRVQSMILMDQKLTFSTQFLSFWKLEEICTALNDANEHVSLRGSLALLQSGFQNQQTWINNMYRIYETKKYNWQAIRYSRYFLTFIYKTMGIHIPKKETKTKTSNYHQCWLLCYLTTSYMLYSIAFFLMQEEPLYNLHSLNTSAVQLRQTYPAIALYFWKQVLVPNKSLWGRIKSIQSGIFSYQMCKVAVEGIVEQHQSPCTPDLLSTLKNNKGNTVSRFSISLITSVSRTSYKVEPEQFKKIGPWDLCWFKRWRIYLLCFFVIGSKFVDISFAGVSDIFWTFLTHFS